MPPGNARFRPGLSIQFALLAVVTAALLAGVVPAGLLLEHWVTRELEARERDDVAMAPRVLAERNAALADAMMMRAKDLAHEPALAAALLHGDVETASRLTEQAARAAGGRPVLVAADGRLLDGVAAPPELLAATRAGAMPVAVVADGPALYTVAIAPVEGGGRWLGAAGMAAPLDEAAAEALAGLTRSDLVLFLHGSLPPVASRGDSVVVRAIARAAPAAGAGAQAREIRVGSRRFVVAVAPLGSGSVVFVRDLDRALSILPRLRRGLGVSGAAALLVALLLAWLLAFQIGRPVRVLAAAAGGVSHGDFEAPLARSPIRELDRVTEAFDHMRRALAVRIDELRAANRALEDRQARLTALQAELIRRERVAVSSRLVAELAHEIRNPIANVRNCLELLHRRLERDTEVQEFAALAIDELLRMHELAERMLDLNRPREAAVHHSDVAAVANEVAALARLGRHADETVVTVRAQGRPAAAIPPDALKQVLLNLLQNAREVVPRDLRLDIEIGQHDDTVLLAVADNGPGIPEAIRERVFDPFFTTRPAAGGVGLGLTVVEAILRRYGGSVTVGGGGGASAGRGGGRSGGADGVGRASAGGGACFRIRLPAVETAPRGAASGEPAPLPASSARRSATT